MRSGSLSVRYQRCSKSPCVCDDPKHPGHGPIYSFSTDEFVEYREKSLLTVLGDVSVNRAYYYDKACTHENKADEFGKRIYGEAMRRGLQRAEKICVIGDGAPWIWNIADEQFYGDIQIIDLYHYGAGRYSVSTHLFEDVGGYSRNIFYRKITKR